MKQVTAPIISRSEVTPGVYLVWLECPEIASPAQPGQFVMVSCGEGCLLRRPLSIHGLANNRTELALLFTVIGRGTRWLAQCQVGDSLDLLGPLGNSFSINPAAHNLLLVAGGMGIAPLSFVAQEALSRGCLVTLLYGTANINRYPQALLPTGTRLVAATEDGSVGRTGNVTSLLPDFTPWADQVFVCGPVAMYRDIAWKRQDLKLGSKPVQVSLEARMGCGLGVCYACTVKTRHGLRQVCKDGPVFDLDDVLWDELNY